MAEIARFLRGQQFEKLIFKFLSLKYQNKKYNEMFFWLVQILLNKWFLMSNIFQSSNQKKNFTVYFLFWYLRLKNLKINFSNCCPRRNLAISANHYTIGYEESFGRKIARFQRGQHRGKKIWNFKNFFIHVWGYKKILWYFS